MVCVLTVAAFVALQSNSILCKHFCSLSEREREGERKRAGHGMIKRE